MKKLFDLYENKKKEKGTRFLTRDEEKEIEKMFNFEEFLIEYGEIPVFYKEPESCTTQITVFSNPLKWGEYVIRLESWVDSDDYFNEVNFRLKNFYLTDFVDC